MIRILLATTSFGIGLAFSAPARCDDVVPVAATKDQPRVMVAKFNPDQIISVRVPPGGIQIVFSPDETQFDVGLAGAWLWDRSQNTLFFQAGPGTKKKVVYVVSTLPGNETRRYQMELIPVADNAQAAPPWRRAPGLMEAQASTVSDVMADGALPNADPAPEPLPAVVRFTYEKQEAAAKAEAARVKHVEAVRQWQANGGTRQGRAGVVLQARLRAEVLASAQAAAGRKRCNTEGRGDTALLPRAVCNVGTYTTFAYTGMTVPALFGVGPDGKDVKVQQEPVPGRPGLILARATFEFWRARYGNVQVAEMYDASYDVTGIPVTGTDTASPNVRMTIPASAVRPARSGQ